MNLDHADELETSVMMHYHPELVNLDEAVTTMFPLLEPAFDDLANQIVRNQSVSDIAYSDDNKYTSLVLLDAIKTSLGKAKTGVH